MSKRLLALALSGMAMALSACASTPSGGEVTLHILAINDFHGNLDAPSTGLSQPDPADVTKNIRIPAGGAARLATLVKQLQARSPDTIMVGAGDLIGASPLLSGLFHDEPSVESLSQMGLAISAVGNHEFDDGPAELRRMQEGGCHPKDGCNGPHPYKGAGYRYLSASTVDDATGKTVFPPYEIRTFKGVKVGFIGLSLKGTPALIAPSVAAGLTFRDEAETVNQLVPVLKAKGVEAIVVLLHEGGFPGRGAAACPELSGAIMEIVPKLDRAVDVIISGHTHNAYICTVDGRLVTSGGLYGMMLSDITVTLDRRTGDVTKADGQNIVVRTDVYAEDPAQVALIETYRKIANPLMNRPVGQVTAALSRDRNDAEEFMLGKVIADAMLAAVLAKTGKPADVAFMNPAGVRGAIDMKNDGAVTFADVFAVQPFGNTIVVLSLTGRQIETLLGQQFSRERPMVLQVSEGFAFAWRKDASGGGALVPGSVMIGGRPLDPAATYRVATNNFLAAGGDGFTTFQASPMTEIGLTDAEALEALFKARSPFVAPQSARVTLQPAG